MTKRLILVADSDVLSFCYKARYNFTLFTSVFTLTCKHAYTTKSTETSQSGTSPSEASPLNQLLENFQSPKKKRRVSQKMRRLLYVLLESPDYCFYYHLFYMDLKQGT